MNNTMSNMEAKAKEETEIKRIKRITLIYKISTCIVALLGIVSYWMLVYTNHLPELLDCIK